MPAGPLDPDRLAATEFSTSFRGYDTDEVRALLVSVSEALRAAGAREHELREQLALAEQHLRELRAAAVVDVEQAVEEGRREGREMVAEAQRVRERMLGDLARRRRNVRQQVEQLMAGRERLLETFELARQTIEAATHDMRSSLPEARLAAEAAGRRFDQDGGEEPDEAVAALEDEIEAARLAGLPIIEPGAGDGGRADEAAPSSGEPSLLGERDVREMPPVELGAEFEDVRIVPLQEAAPVEERVATEGEDVQDEDVQVEVEDEVDGVEDDEVEEETEAAEVEDEAGVAEPAADPEHLDDLFASLRASRADAVIDARTVLAREDETPVDDDPTPEPPASIEPEAEAEPEAEPEAVPEPEAGPEPDPDSEPAMHALDVDGALVAAADQLASALKRVLANEQNELLERLRGLRKNESAADDEVLGDGGALTERFAAAAAEPLSAVAGAAMASVQPGPRARPPAAGPMAGEVAAGVVGPLHERLARGLADAGTDADEAANRVRSTFREWKTQRIAALSADAARSAYHAGLLAGVAKGRSLQWLLDDEEDACAECADNALAGPVVRGDDYPTGHRHPPAHDGCRCRLAPLPEDAP